MGFVPRLAPENTNGGAVRLDRIAEIIGSSRFGIHDLSRCKAVAAGDFARMNMPFELGLDHAASRFGGPLMSTKTILILEEQRYYYQKSLSDIAGWDIFAHKGDYREAIRCVRGWLVHQPGATRIGQSLIEGQYDAFQQWYYDRELHEGASAEDIEKYPTIELVTGMLDWYQSGKPLSFTPPAALS